MPDHLGGQPEAAASPPCGAATADDLYMGFAPREELLAACRDLLRQQRSALRQWDSCPDKPAATACRDEAQACAAILADTVRALGGDDRRGDDGRGDDGRGGAAPAGKRPALFDRPDWCRQQDAMAARVDALLPRIRDDRLHAGLCALGRRLRAAAGRP